MQGPGGFDPYGGFRQAARVNQVAVDTAIGLPPAPRELTPRMKTYLARQPRGAWLVLVVTLFVLSFSGAFIVPQTEMFVWPTIWLVLSIVLYRRVRQRRARLRRVLTAGDVVPAQVVDVQRTVYRRNLMVVGTMVRATLTFEGKTVTYASGDGTLTSVQPGVTIRVLQHPDLPDVVVPIDSVV